MLRALISLSVRLNRTKFLLPSSFSPRVARALARVGRGRTGGQGGLGSIELSGITDGGVDEGAWDNLAEDGDACLVVGKTSWIRGGSFFEGTIVLQLLALLELILLGSNLESEHCAGSRDACSDSPEVVGACWIRGESFCTGNAVLQFLELVGLLGSNLAEDSAAATSWIGSSSLGFGKKIDFRSERDSSESPGDFL